MIGKGKRCGFHVARDVGKQKRSEASHVAIVDRIKQACGGFRQASCEDPQLVELTRGRQCVHGIEVTTPRENGVRRPVVRRLARAAPGDPPR